MCHIFPYTKGQALTDILNTHSLDHREILSPLHMLIAVVTRKWLDSVIFKGTYPESNCLKSHYKRETPDPHRRQGLLNFHKTIANIRKHFKAANKTNYQAVCAETKF